MPNLLCSLNIFCNGSIVFLFSKIVSFVIKKMTRIEQTYLHHIDS